MSKQSYLCHEIKCSKTVFDSFINILITCSFLHVMITNPIENQSDFSTLRFRRRPTPGRATLSLSALWRYIYDVIQLFTPILGLQSISRDVAVNVSHPRRLDPTVELITYSFVLYLQHSHHDVECKPSMMYFCGKK